MGYSRASSQSLSRASRTWTFPVLPAPVRPVRHHSACFAIVSEVLLRTLWLIGYLLQAGSSRHPIRLVIRAVPQHGPGNAGRFVGQRCCRLP
jgi:hypothetical protein